MLLVAWLACKPLTVVATAPSLVPDSSDTGSNGATSGHTTNTTTPEPIDTAIPYVREETVPSQIVDDSWLFTDTHILEISLALSPEAMAALFLEPREDVEGTLVIDGVEAETVGVRLAGKIGSFRDLNGKPKFRFDFNRYSPGYRFEGLESLALNNSVQDCSGLKEPAAYRLYNQGGGKGSRTGWAHLTVNGLDYGLYQVAEYPDDRFLVRQFSDPSGTMYDGKYVVSEGPYGTYYTFLDFHDHLVQSYQLEEGVDVGWADVQAVADALDDHTGQPDFYAALGMVVDWPSVHRHLALEQLIGHNDGYALNLNNNRLYFDPSVGGRMTMLTWDLDNSFLVDNEWGFSWANPPGRLLAACRQDPACYEAQRQAAADALATVDMPSLLQWYDDVAAFTLPSAHADPRKEYDNATVDYCRADARGRIERAPQVVRDFWGLP